ncbi:hypothetical protein ACFVTX_05970 [Agromyces sp. NPDC058136]|uniref:hypothetical protein n=1 Tax=Agromyces sp. NPDC058136 TaxID=3346354 RepID=UPI0036DCACDA
MSVTRGATVAASAMLLVALAGCAGNAGTTQAEAELHQERTSRDSAHDVAAADVQGKRLAEQAQANAAAAVGTTVGTDAADAQGARLAGYAASLAESGRAFVAPDRATWAEHRGVDD